jgi:hypothetical protein
MATWHRRSPAFGPPEIPPEVTTRPLAVGPYGRPVVRPVSRAVPLAGGDVIGQHREAGGDLQHGGALGGIADLLGGEHAGAGLPQVAVTGAHGPRTREQCLLFRELRRYPLTPKPLQLVRPAEPERSGALNPENRAVTPVCH